VASAVLVETKHLAPVHLQRKTKKLQRKVAKKNYMQTITTAAELASYLQNVDVRALYPSGREYDNIDPKKAWLEEATLKIKEFAEQHVPQDHWIELGPDYPDHGEWVLAVDKFDDVTAVKWHKNYIHGNMFKLWKPYPKSPKQLADESTIKKDK
jgi:hypothetical protein